METKSTPASTLFVPGTSRHRESGTTFRLEVARSRTELLEMGARIARLRAEHGYRQQWIADQVGVTLRTYQFWQQGKSPPGQENLEKLAELFGVEPKYILKGDTPALEGIRSEQLDRIESAISDISQRLARLELATTGDGFTRAVQGALEHYAGQLNPRKAKRPAQSKRRAGRSSEAPSNAA